MLTFPSDHPLAQALAERDYKSPTSVQAAVLEAEPDRDLLVSAQTGSGKTVAYGLSIADDLLAGGPLPDPAGEPLALIVAPTRELALQVQRELMWLYEPVGGKVVACVGGMDPRAEQRVLARGCHIVVGTPGRLRDHLERGALQIGNLRALVLDEADEMLDLGFREDLEFILEATPEQRRTLLFSATLPKPIVALAKRYQKDALRIAVEGGEQGHADIEHRAVRVAPNEVEHAVINLLRFYDAQIAMVFCNTRDSVSHLQAVLTERGFSAVALSGELGQNERNRALQSLRDGRARVCVATDVAARGIDLPNLGLVIHAEMPQSAQTFQHRSGRTGRAGKKGVSVVVVPLSRRRRAEALLNTAGVTAIWGAAPNADEIRKLDQERLLQSPILTEEVTEEDLVIARALLAERSAEQLASALVRIYRSQLPAAEELFDLSDASAQPPPAFKTRHEEAKQTVWFKLNAGREKNADPRWLLPMICRMGKITKSDIGAIRIFDRDTKFEDADGADIGFGDLAHAADH
ncbi:MAG TPA: DEAD/DEAH box helicase, partial [Magnetospirillaceae bacterium]|nr:DEAD/DEAH box helicase [Magnetospirillaceae bacterium]